MRCVVVWVVCVMGVMGCRREEPSAPAAPVAVKVEAAPAQVEAPAAQVEAPAALLEDADALARLPTGAAPALKLGGGLGMALEAQDGVLTLDGASVRDAPDGARAYEPLSEDATRVTYFYEGERHVATLLRAPWTGEGASSLPEEVPEAREDALVGAKFVSRDRVASQGRAGRLESRYFVYDMALAQGVRWPWAGLTLSPASEHTCVEDEGCPRRPCACGEGGAGPFVFTQLVCGEESLCTEQGLIGCAEACAGR
jgi:hypothetical protein